MVLFAITGSLTLTNATFVGNSAKTDTAGPYATSSTTTLNNTLGTANVLANSTTASDTQGSVYAGSHKKLYGPGSSGGLSNGSGGNIVLAAGPGTLGNYVGSTPTIPLLPGSPAINADSLVNFSLTNVAAHVSSTVGVAWGSAGVATLLTNSDGPRLLPSGRTNDMLWAGISKLRITLMMHR